ncbi:MAG: hybrid sensor histidine kinase/response regulator [Bacteroidales bacterium]|nr:hybrid sensor histidine kinase/response regulator [Bacteroidales bacterium]
MNKVKENKDFRILIVDDVPKNIQVLGNILINEKYQISYTQDGNHALSLIKKNKFDLILLDIMMPEIDGYEVCKTIMADPETASIPVIFLTAKADKESVIKGFKLGARDYVTKPFNAEELLARVRTHLELKDKNEQLANINKTLEQKVLERTIKLRYANKKLLTLDKAKGDFLNIISHEMRTPLNGIQGLTSLLTDSTEINDKNGYIKNLKIASDRLVKFSETALLITSLNTERYLMKTNFVGLKDLINNCFETKLQKIEKKINFNINVVPDNIKIVGDYELLKDCFESIIDNAIKYSPDKDEIKIIVYRDNDKVIVSFKDNGTGFSDEAKEKLFNYFSSDDIMHSEGLGLGLASVKLIMDAHQGKVEIKNMKDGGAIVNLFFYD